MADPSYFLKYFHFREKHVVDYHGYSALSNPQRHLTSLTKGRIFEGAILTSLILVQNASTVLFLAIWIRSSVDDLKQQKTSYSQAFRSALKRQ